MRHTIADLKQMQSLPLDAKVQMTKARVRAWYEHFDGQVYVSFSGGKDSTVLKHVVDSMYDDVPSVFVNTGLEYPEVRRFALSFPGVVRIDPAMKFYEIVERYGYPVVSKAVSDTVAGAHLEKAPNRFQRMKKTHPRQWDYCMTDLGLKQVLDYLGVESE